MKEWSKEVCSSKPDELQIIAPGLYIQRRDIQQVEHEEADGVPAYTSWECESREISISEYEMLASIEDIDTSKALDEYTMQLIEEGVL